MNAVEKRAEVEALRHVLVDTNRRITQLEEEIRREEEDRFVGVQFHANSIVYTYQLAPGHTAKIGDYVAIWSPRTEQVELVRVVRMGRGSWRHGTKIARAITWSCISDDNFSDTRPL